MEESMNLLDRAEKGYFSFHLQFLLKLTRYFGIEPADMQELVHQIDDSSAHVTVPTMKDDYIKLLLNQPMGFVVNVNNELRRELVELLILYYKSHFEQLHSIKSYEVLKEVFEK
jgi:DNA repair protein RecO (recombination protein O)